MKIALISSLYGLEGGGAGLLVRHLAEGLAAAGHQVAVVATGSDWQMSLSEEQGVRVIRFRPFNLYPLLEKERHPAWQKILWQALDIYNLHSAFVLQRVLKKEAPDIVHVHKMRGLSGAVWPTASSLFPGRVIQTCHDYESMSPDGYLRGLAGRLAAQGRWPLRGYQLARRYLSRGVAALTAPSRFTLERIVASGLFPNARPQVIANTHGLSQSDLESIAKRSRDPLENESRLLYIGRLEKEKGLIELCEAFLLASRRVPSMRLELAGWGSLEVELRKKYGGYPGIRFLGALTGAEKKDALARSSFVVVPSLWEEVFGIVTVEAYAFGKPVIASQVGGLPELVRPGETGWLVRPGNRDDLAGCMIEAAEMEAGRRAEMSRACRSYACDFSLEKILARYLDLYDRLQRQIR